MLTTNNTLVPNDLKIAITNPTSTGRVDIASGLFTINYWTFVGDWNGNATLNLTGTTTSSPGTYTGRDQGTGSFDSDNNNNNGNFMVGLFNSTGVFNMNTSGALNVTELRLSPNGQAGTSTFNLDSGSVNVQGSFQVGSDYWGANTNSPASFNMSGGTVTTGWEVWTGGSGIGTSVMTGGVINSGAWFVVGRNNGSVGNFTMSSGTVNAATTQVGSFPVVGSFGGSQGTLNVQGGLFTTGATNRKMIIGEGGTGTLNVSGSGHVVIGNNVAGDGFRLGANATGSGTVNLTGGILEVGYLTKGSGTGTLNINGGTLKVASTHTGANTFVSGLKAANVLTGGAIIDTNSLDAVISQNLLGSLGDGGLTKNGAGTLTLSGSNTYNGPTVVNGGSLIVTGALANTSGVSLGAGTTLGGTGSIAGTVTLGSGIQLLFNPTTPLTISGSASFASPSTFGVDDIIGVSSSTPDGTYTLISGLIDLTGIQNLGVGNAYDLGGGKSAYFQSGSLNLVVVPEPTMMVSSLAVLSCSLAVLRRRPRQA